jgi:hypothetical protein
MSRDRTGVRAIGLAALAGLLLLGACRPEREIVRLHDATPREEALVDWAIGRYQAAGMWLPPIDVYFHADASACADNSGIYSGGRLDICSAHKATAYARKVLVHEMAHAWSDAHITPTTIEAFLDLRRLKSWGSWEEPWGLRGYEQAAEIITWGVGDGAIEPLLPTDDDPEQLEIAFQLLVGRPPLRVVG